MAGHLTPAERRISADLIPDYRRMRHRTAFRGCTQIYQIFLKSDGKISCSCMRYRDILADARELNVAEFFNGELMRYIRESFREGYEPFDICAACSSRVSEGDFPSGGKIIDLHIEPSNRCNLFCEVCTCTDERQSDNPPMRVNLDFAIYEKVVREIHAARLDVRAIALVGFGEPLFNSRTHDMARLGRQLFPRAWIFLDTNANFGERRAEELADCGLNEIRLALDGADQESYEGYRKNGEFAKALKFARTLAAAIREKSSPTRAIWKYILFRHNDRDDQILAAARMADEIGLPIAFDATVGKLASKRSLEDIHRVVGDRRFGCNIDPASVVKGKRSLRMPSVTRQIARFLGL